MKNYLTILAAFVFCAPFCAFDATAQRLYKERDGLVVMEMENTLSPAGRWAKINPGDPHFVDGATGSGHIEFTGNTINGGPPNSPLTYAFMIHKTGKYYLNLRGRKRLAGAESDKCNDCYIRLQGNFRSGSDQYPTETLRRDTKLYLSRSKNDDGARTWAWSTHLDGNGADHAETIYVLQANQVYQLTVSGRSIRYNLDRIVLRHEDVKKWVARDPKLPESPTSLSQTASQEIPANGVVVWNAIKDFKDIGSGNLKFYRNKKFDALAINAASVSMREKFMTASRKFDLPSGTYAVRLTTLTEEDGESTYRLMVNQNEVATFTNPHIGPGSDRDLEPHQHVFENIKIENGDTISVQANTHTNGEIPEKGGTAWSRGRWRQIEFSQTSFASNSDQ